MSYTLHNTAQDNIAAGWFAEVARMRVIGLHVPSQYSLPKALSGQDVAVPEEYLIESVRRYQAQLDALVAFPQEYLIEWGESPLEGTIAVDYLGGKSYSRLEDMDRLRQLERLHREGCLALEMSAVGQAQSILGVLHDRGIIPSAINPTPEGSILIEFGKKSRYDALEVYGGDIVYHVVQHVGRDTVVNEVYASETNRIAELLTDA